MRLIFALGTMEKLELKHVAPYLPYGLAFICFDVESKEFEELPLVSINLANEELEIGGMDIPIDELPYPIGLEIKPILRPLSDLTKEIEVNGEKFVPRVKMGLIHDVSGNNIFNYRTGERINILSLPYYKIEYLFEWHFDVFGLIEQGLAIDINTL